MSAKILSFLKVGIAFFIWSLLGPILNLSRLDPFQNLLGILNELAQDVRRLASTGREN